MFNKNKTKWKPLYFYEDEGHQKMIFVRLDKETGLFDFKTKLVGDYCYNLKYNIDSQVVLDSLLNTGKQSKIQEQIKQEIEDLEKCLTKKNMHDAVMQRITGQIESLKWVLESEANNDKL